MAMIRKKEKPVFKSKKQISNIMCDLKKNTKEYNLKNVITEGDFVLYKSKGNKILLDFPWKTGWRKFYGNIYEIGGDTYLEGEFRVPRIIVFMQALFWLMVWCSLIYLSIDISLLELIKEGDKVIKYSVPLYGGAISISLFYIWFLLIYRNKQTENRIKEVLLKAIED